MSKAFTKESDDDALDAGELGGNTYPPLPSGAKNYMTPPGARALREEIRQLSTEKRPALALDLTVLGQRALRELDRRLRFLKTRAEVLEEVDPARQNPDRVAFGAEVTVVDEEARTRLYRLVGIDEAEPSAGRISWLAPLSQALLNARVGDVVRLHTPRGEQELEVTRIRYDV